MLLSLISASEAISSQLPAGSALGLLSLDGDSMQPARFPLCSQPAFVSLGTREEKLNFWCQDF